VDAVLGTCSLPQLRERTGAKWRTYPADVLPAFVAEMDFDLAPPIARAVTAALAIGDCGYAHKGALGEAYAAFAANRLGWEVDPRRVYPIPDVMTGLAEVSRPSPRRARGSSSTPPSTRRSGTGSAYMGGGSSTRRWPGTRRAGTTWTRRRSKRR